MYIYIYIYMFVWLNELSISCMHIFASVFVSCAVNLSQQPFDIKQTNDLCKNKSLEIELFDHLTACKQMSIKLNCYQYQ